MVEHVSNMHEVSFKKSSIIMNKGDHLEADLTTVFNKNLSLVLST